MAPKPYGNVGAATGLEPRDSTGARLHQLAEPKELPWSRSHVTECRGLGAM
jgi:alkylated DNA nucleotide flippase Atl1